MQRRLEVRVRHGVPVRLHASRDLAQAGVLEARRRALLVRETNQVVRGIILARDGGARRPYDTGQPTFGVVGVRRVAVRPVDLRHDATEAIPAQHQALAERIRQFRNETQPVVAQRGRRSARVGVADKLPRGVVLVT